MSDNEKVLDNQTKILANQSTLEGNQGKILGNQHILETNQKTIIDNQEIPGITGGAINSHEALPAPIYLQGSEKGHVAFRSIVITPAK